jgi:CRP/FNR family transcriptional regulator
VRDFRAGHTFFRAGQKGEQLFVLESGAVQTFRGAGRRKLIIAELKPPAIFGEMALAGESMYHCSAETVRASRIRSIARPALDALIDEYPILARRLLDVLSQRFLRVLADLESTSFCALLPRVAGLLLERAIDGRVEGLTHQEIAEQLRVYRESVSETLGQLRRAGVIAVERKRIRVLDRARLERAARE